MGRYNRRIQELLAQKDGHNGSGIGSLKLYKKHGGFGSGLLRVWVGCTSRAFMTLMAAYLGYDRVCICAAKMLDSIKGRMSF